MGQQETYNIIRDNEGITREDLLKKTRVTIRTLNTQLASMISSNEVFFTERIKNIDGVKKTTKRYFVTD